MEFFSAEYSRTYRTGIYRSQHQLQRDIFLTSKTEQPNTGWITSSVLPIPFSGNWNLHFYYLGKKIYVPFHFL